MFHMFDIGTKRCDSEASLRLPRTVCALHYKNL